MIVSWKDAEVYADGVSPVVPDVVASIIKGEIEKAFTLRLEVPFLVNDTVWYELKGNKLNPRVTNKADHISRGFQEGLAMQGWLIDHKLAGQEIDAFKNLSFERVQVDALDDHSLRTLVSSLPLDANFSKACFTLYHCHHLKPYFASGTAFLRTGFRAALRDFDLKVGVEFETGNIASSFRALSKLRFLFRNGDIDLGVFITSETKRISTRIWPSANRNGSLEELRQRRFLADAWFPLLVAGFGPDGWSDRVLYLAKSGRYAIESDQPHPSDPTLVQSKDGRLVRRA